MKLFQKLFDLCICLHCLFYTDIKDENIEHGYKDLYVFCQQIFTGCLMIDKIIIGNILFL